MRPARASGTFEDRKWKLDLAGAYAFWDRSSGPGDENVLRLAVSNAEFEASALDDHYDRAHAIATRFEDAETKVVYFEFDGSGRYLGLSYYFESGVGCGFCYDSSVKSTARLADGRFGGRLAYRGEDRRFDVTFDVPVPPRTWGEALPPGGGAPAAAYLDYAAALATGDPKSIRPHLDDSTRARWDRHAEKGDLEAYVDYLWDDAHARMKEIRITGGYARGDRAVVLFDGSSALIDRLHGEALLRREAGEWRMHTEMVDVGAR